MSKLNIDQQTIKELFTNKKADFLIPDYQRPYAWDENECQTLWDDIFAFAFPNDNYSEFDTENDEYFLGPIVTFKNDDNKANIDRKLFSKIRCDKDYKPKKKTAVALAIALELSYEDMTDLLARAGIALSPSSRFDIIIQYFVMKKIYDVSDINLALFKHGQQTLGE